MSGIIASQCRQTAESLVRVIKEKINSLDHTQGDGTCEVKSYLRLARECISECSIERSLESHLHGGLDNDLHLD